MYKPRDGRDGRDGVDGRAGLDGKDGFSGLRGPKGDKGDCGERGEKGERGNDSPQTLPVAWDAVFQRDDAGRTQHVDVFSREISAKHWRITPEWDGTQMTAASIAPVN